MAPRRFLRSVLPIEIRPNTAVVRRARQATSLPAGVIDQPFLKRRSSPPHADADVTRSPDADSRDTNAQGRFLAVHGTRVGMFVNVRVLPS
jgi:hypothetical protein